MTRTRSLAAAAAAILLMACSAMSALAAPVTISFTYQQGAARAVGSVTFESTLIANPGNNSFVLPNPAVLNIQMTVTGATAGNGTFTTADFTQVFFDTGGATLNLRQPLIGQPTPGNPWGTTQDGTSGDLNFFGAAPTPNGTFFFTLTANGGAANSMILVAAAPVGVGSDSIPTLSEWMIGVLVLLVGAIGMAGIGYRKA